MKVLDKNIFSPTEIRPNTIPNRYTGYTNPASLTLDFIVNYFCNILGKSVNNY